jgi:hypothetical protein
MMRSRRSPATPDGIAWIPEVEVDPVTEQLDHVAAVTGGDLADELCEREGRLSRDRVSEFLGELRVPGKVREDGRLRISRTAPPHAGVLQRGLYVLELMLGHEDFGVPPEEPSEKVLP